MVGYKPTRGLISFEGITPACLSLDCVAIIATNVADARTVWQLCEEFDPHDRYAKDALPPERHVDSLGAQSRTFKFGVPPPEVLNICTPTYRRLFNEAIRTLQSCGGVLTPIDWTPFRNGGDLLYDGAEFMFVTEQSVVEERARKIAEDPDRLRKWNEYRSTTLHPGEA